uniref:START domain-containing protein n=1 Tax=Heterorhabditis bacteriophora TaxID=37862 RepID=A0A1I7WL45_HETBA
MKNFLDNEKSFIGKIGTVSAEVRSVSHSTPKAVSGRDIIRHYIKGDPVALVTYRKICNALEILEKWEDSAKIQFLEQFLDMSDFLDNRCTQLVTNLAVRFKKIVVLVLPWHTIPSGIIDRYQNMLCACANFNIDFSIDSIKYYILLLHIQNMSQPIN